ncbi:MAG: hypothetical protein ACI90V_000548 [Bacillariaceae sp.]|jgi:hypothetical protein
MEAKRRIKRTHEQLSIFNGSKTKKFGDGHDDRPSKW